MLGGAARQASAAKSAHRCHAPRRLHSEALEAFPTTQGLIARAGKTSITFTWPNAASTTLYASFSDHIVRLLADERQ